MEEGTTVEGMEEMAEATSRSRMATLRSSERLSRWGFWLLLCLAMVTSLHA